MISSQRRHLPRIDQEHVFEGPKGTETPAQLFAGKSQLIAYHFMFAPDWDAGCPSCSFIGLKRDGIWLNHRRALGCCLSMIFFGKPVPTFPDHALAYCFEGMP